MTYNANKQDACAEKNRLLPVLHPQIHLACLPVCQVQMQFQVMAEPFFCISAEMLSYKTDIPVEKVKDLFFVFTCPFWHKKVPISANIETGINYYLLFSEN